MWSLTFHNTTTPFHRCPYCQKVWIALEEKRIPYRIEKVNMRCYGDKPASFNRMQPSGQIPVAVIDGVVYGQSNDILARFESDDFQDYKSLTTAYKTDERRARELLRLERSVFSAWMYWLTSSPSNKQMFVDAIDQVESALQASSGPFFLGDDISMVDIQFAPFLERMAASMVYYKGFVIRVAPGTTTDYPNINKWFDAMESLDSYRLTKSDYYTHCWDLPPQLGGCVAEPAGEKFRKAINGERTLDGTRGSWKLPLQPHNGGAEPDWDWVDEAEAKREAVERVTSNFDAIVRFASRGAGRRGMPSVSAPLADPNAIPNEAVQGAVGVILRLVCAAILETTTNNNDRETTMKSIASSIKEDGGSETVQAVIDSLSYLRERVGVPRDMRLPAARQLRAHLNWAIGHLL
jgi:glutathione S-transferase